MTLLARAPKAIEAAIKSSLFFSETNGIFREGIDLLKDLTKSTLPSLQVQAEADAIIIGTVICALAYEAQHEGFGNNQEQFKNRYGLTAMYPRSWLEITQQRELSEADLQSKDWAAKLILAVGRKALEQKLPVFGRDSFTANGVLIKLFSDLSEKNSEEQFEKYKDYSAYQHKQIYLAHYKKQSFKTNLLRLIGPIIAVLSAFIPPLSLFFTIPSQRQLRKDKLASDIKPRPLWKQVLMCFFAAVIPGFSGALSFVAMDHLITARQKEYLIQKTTYKKSDNDLQLIKNNRAALKDNRKDVAWPVVVTPEQPHKKPKKVVIAYKDKDGIEKVDVYRDSAQAERNEAIRSNKYMRHTGTQITDFFKSSVAKSVAIDKQLEQQYLLRPGSK